MVQGTRRIFNYSFRQKGFLRLNNYFCYSTKQCIPRKNGWESIIGLEIHAQILTDSKLFSNAGNSYGAPVNTQVSLFDAAIPGTLPVINRQCVEAGVLTAMTLSCKINPISSFDRKHYFYADLPSGYQITQQRKAIANDGELSFVVYTPGVHKKPYYTKSKIRQLQLEQDSGKSLHDSVEQRSLIDLNRAGIALMEIVFEPDLHDGEEAGALVKELSLILQNLKTCNCKMEEGSLRVDANISVRKVGEELGTRAEVKNISSVRSLVNAVEFEVDRQITLIENGGFVVNETRSYDAEGKQTLPMRDKEVMQDYRFMPEPNLPFLKLVDDPLESNVCNNTVNIAHVKKGMKEMPESMRRQLMDKYNLRLENAIVIVNTTGLFQYFTSVMETTPAESGMKVANILQTELTEFLNEANITFRECPIVPADVGKLVKLLVEEKVNYGKAISILDLIFKGDQRSPDQILLDEGWLQVSDDAEIEKICRQIISQTPKIVQKYRQNEQKRPKFLKPLLAEASAMTGGIYNMKKMSDMMQRCLLEEKQNT